MGKMMLLRLKSFRVGLVLLAVLLIAFELPPRVSAQEVDLGPIKTCNHDFKGKVIALNKRQLKISEFTYDGKGPASWFHAMKKGAAHIFGDPADKFDLISNSITTCEKLKFHADGGAVINGDVTLTFPADITEYETIGIFCHFACANFGFLKLDHEGKTYADPPAEAANVKACQVLSRDEITKLADVGTAAKPKCDQASTTSTNYDCTPLPPKKEEGGSTEGGSGAADAVGSVGCIAGGVFAVSLLTTRN